MLTADYESEQEGITVPYSPLFDGMRQNHGFVDLRGHPELAAEIPECAKSPALKALLMELSNREASFFTLGCDLGSHEEPELGEGNRYVAGGYIQLMHACYADRLPEDYTNLGYAIAQKLEEQSHDYNWIVRFVPSFVVFNLDNFSNLASSLWIWFYATAPTSEAALASREVFLAMLHDNLVDEQLQAFLDERLDADGRGEIDG